MDSRNMFSLFVILCINYQNYVGSSHLQEVPEFLRTRRHNVVEKPKFQLGKHLTEKPKFQVAKHLVGKDSFPRSVIPYSLKTTKYVHENKAQPPKYEKYKKIADYRLEHKKVQPSISFKQIKKPAVPFGFKKVKEVRQNPLVIGKKLVTPVHRVQAAPILHTREHRHFEPLPVVELPPIVSLPPMNRPIVLPLSADHYAHPLIPAVPEVQVPSVFMGPHHFEQLPVDYSLCVSHPWLCEAQPQTRMLDNFLCFSKPWLCQANHLTAPPLPMNHHYHQPPMISLFPPEHAICESMPWLCQSGPYPHPTATPLYPPDHPICEVNPFLCVIN